MTSKYTRAIFAAAVFVGAGAILIEWFVSPDVVRMARSGGLVTMKATTAFSFMVMAAAQYLGIRGHRKWSIRVAFSTFIWPPFLIAAGYATGAVLPLNDLPLQSVGAGIPSIGTLLCFLLLAFATVNDSKWTFRSVRLLSAIALLGYALEAVWIEAPLLYWYIPNVSTAMAVPTAGLFFILSLCRND